MKGIVVCVVLMRSELTTTLRVWLAITSPSSLQ